ncbi:hypothetical protein BASA81_009132 [Batrachochytrium salamandrivorans]|nr:hypothetical protein BASA81_009132 [Batrachochytrium salamandrivorans]
MSTPFATILEEYRPHLLGLVCACLGYWLCRQPRSQRMVHSRQIRHTLSPEPEHGRLVEIGLGEREYLRMGLDHNSALKIFLVASLQLEKKIDHNRLLERLGRSLEHLQRLHPLLRCRLVKLDDGQMVLEEDVDLKLQIHSYWDEDYKKVFETVGERRVMPVGKNAESPHACWLFCHSDNNNVEIALDLAHFAVDGSGLGPLMHEFLQAAFEFEPESEIKTLYAAWPQVQEIALQRTVDNSMSYWQSKLGLFKTFCLPIYLLITGDYNVLPRDDSAPYSQLSVRFRTLCLAECFTVEETKALLQCCRDNKVSVTAAVAAAMTEECGRRVDRNRAFSVPVVFVADSRGLCDTPVPPASDLTPHVLALPAYFTPPKIWKSLPVDSVKQTWAEAQRMRQFLTETTANTVFCRFYALLVSFFLQQQPTNVGVPAINVSSWSAKSPVKHVYGDKVRVERVELLQNMSASSWLNLSMYTMVDRLTVSLFVPVPRYDEVLVREIFSTAITRIRMLLEKGE